MDRTIILAGKRTALAVMTAEDQPAFQRWLAENPELRALIDDHHVPTMEDQLRWFARIQEPDRALFSIVTLPEYQLIGNGGFVHLDPVTHTGTFRITIGDPVFIGKGYGSEASVLLLLHGFSALGLQHVILEVLKSNVRAIRTYEKIGFRPPDSASDTSDRVTMTLDRESFSPSNPS